MLTKRGRDCGWELKRNDNIQNTKKSIKNMIISYTIKLILVVVINISEEVGYRDN